MTKSKTTPKTLLNYMYRDGANFKFRKSVIIDGILKMDDLSPYFYDWDKFIPQAVGLECLVPEDINENDHPWHEIVDMERAKEDGSAICSASDLKSKFIKHHKDKWATAHANYDLPSDPATFGMRRYRP